MALPCERRAAPLVGAVRRWPGAVNIAVADPAFAFGPFRLLPVQRVLLQNGAPVRLGSRAFDLLAFLVEHAGQTFTNDRLMAQVWPNVRVVEGSLRVHVAALRKALGDEGTGGAVYVTNVAGRGYSFVAPVTVEQSAVVPAAVGGASGLPVLLNRVIGRAEISATLAAQLRARRFITILGPGGVGKTTVAVAVAELLADAYPDGVRFVGLGAVTDPALVPSTVLASLGQRPSGPDAMTSLGEALRDKRLLLVFDNCEHVVDAVAAMATTLLQATPGLAILATSREALRVEGEWVQRLPSLAVPPASDGLTATAALGFAAVQLFNERARERVYGFALSDDDVPQVVDICRQLDGIPLALELAAARVDVYGLQGLAALINDRLLLAAQGRRTAQPRHQTLRAMLDWSYDLLTDTEAAVLRRLAVFTGDFSYEAASAVVGDLAGRALTDHVISLVRKSLVVADLGDVTRYRLLFTTRLYVLEKLRAADEFEDATRRHAEYLKTVESP
jgi:predicted ATPase/DNA-binding winged helix-turn-helix (wHTH) protein